MGGWKADIAGSKDSEADRIDRQKAAFGTETIAKLKGLYVLIIGLRGVGVEAAKNLILSNVGGVVVWDPERAVMRDLGTNFYLTEQHARDGTLRREACLPQLKSLNPYCKVEEFGGDLTDEYLLSLNDSGHPFAAIIVTQFLPKATLFRINRTARENNIAFLVAINNGVTASLFSDFGPSHTITDWNGEPTEARALSNIEVVVKPASLQVGASHAVLCIWRMPRRDDTAKQRARARTPARKHRPLVVPLRATDTRPELTASCARRGAAWLFMARTAFLPFAGRWRA